ncbi:MAG: hypothetical protein M1368_02230 [Thaumarchaeota archaeon]|nr:hypothetical protein [Nitrososphaerota archaeon]
MGTYHSQKDIDKVIREAVSHGWLCDKKGQAHVVVTLYCAEPSSNRCRFWLDGTPRNPSGAAKRLRGQLAKCSHGYAIPRK